MTKPLPTPPFNYSEQGMGIIVIPGEDSFRLTTPARPGVLNPGFAGAPQPPKRGHSKAEKILG